MQYSNQKEHEGFVIQKRNRRKVYAVFALIATLLLWITIAGLASSHSSEDGGRSLGRRLAFIPRYSWPTAPPGPAGCI
eukprot:CAMPEP_0182613266 /NCGR_PEP_ID=MMETSP1330-20130603/24563_1 /TAXON_ID=464278 /ORGANISM="Picochlorum sp., Strain RCC944" /LENGTH=77 /DNA_ID=CAMNT_0024832949 /DNA_START=186 /DNA_END=416 /DNA_ORIENTATION=+